MKRFIAVASIVLLLILVGCSSGNVENTLANTLTDSEKEQYQAIVDGAVASAYKGSGYKSDILPNADGVNVLLQLDSNAFKDEQSCKDVAASIIKELTTKSIFANIKAFDFTFNEGSIKRATAKVDNASNIQTLENIESSIVISPINFSSTVSSEGTTTAETPVTPSAGTVKSSQTTEKTNATTVAGQKIAGTAQTVYVTPSGKRYHYDGRCNGGKYSMDTLDNALKRKLTPCEKCVLE